MQDWHWKLEESFVAGYLPLPKISSTPCQSPQKRGFVSKADKALAVTQWTTAPAHSSVKPNSIPLSCSGGRLCKSTPRPVNSDSVIYGMNGVDKAAPLNLAFCESRSGTPPP